MCTIAFLVDVVADAPLAIAANRDELYARKARGPERLAPGVVGGVDELSGGTWFAVRSDGRFAAVTNQRQLAPQPAGARSRGLAVRELAAADDQEAYVAAIDPTQYASMNLVWGDARGIAFAYLNQRSTAITIERVERGIHVLCNNRLRSPGFPRGERLAALLAAAPHAWPAIVEPLQAALADHVRAEPAPVMPPLPDEVVRAVTAICTHTDAYGTRSSTIVAAAPGRLIDYRYTLGRPCESPWQGGMELFA